jgi:signal peptidase I
MADRDDPHPDAPAADDGERLFTASSRPEPAPTPDRPPTPDHAATSDHAPAAGSPGAASGPGEATSGPTLPGEDDTGHGAGAPPPGSTRPARSAEPEDRRHAKGGSFLKELPVLLLIAFVLAFLLRTFVLQVFYIPSSSMEPTLQIDDRMVVEKLTYLTREPRRGEIVVFEGETFVDPYSDQTTVARVVRGVGQFLGVVPASARDFVKRVIGVEGDEVVIEGGQVYVNGEQLDEPYVQFDDGSDYGPITVPEGHLFFLGDNRPNSSDSRRSLGFVPGSHVVGRAAVIIWPPDHVGRLTGITHDVGAGDTDQAGADVEPGVDEADEDQPVEVSNSDS